MELCGLGRNMFVLISFNSKGQHERNKSMHKRQVEISNDVDQIREKKRSYVR